MSPTKVRKEQDLNDWVQMLFALYGSSQNYSKTVYEIHTHLTEVCGIFGKQVFRKRDLEAASDFLPKIFAWSVALFKAIHSADTDLEAVILKKFPRVCPYCCQSPCSCWRGEKPTLDPSRVRSEYFRNATAGGRSLNDFQLMFTRIYADSWKIPKEHGEKNIELLRMPYTRLIEELAEIAEAIRFNHIYPENFENELADLIAWWFCLVSCFPVPGKDMLLAEEILWKAYPGFCPYCRQIPCFCRPGPVRELMSKPPVGQDHKFDSLTGLLNQGAYNEEIGQYDQGTMPIALPVACVRLDVDSFKSVNDTHGHSAGDAALRHIASVLRAKGRERDRIYRISGDEFGVLLMETSEEEAVGIMKRVCRALTELPVRWVDTDGIATLFKVSTSIGVSEVENIGNIKQGFDHADQASYASKAAGKARVTAYSSITKS